MGEKVHTKKDGICIFIKFTLFVYAEINAVILGKNDAPNFKVIRLVWYSQFIIQCAGLQEKSAGATPRPTIMLPHLAYFQ